MQQINNTKTFKKHFPQCAQGDNDEIKNARINRDKYIKLKNWDPYRYWLNPTKTLIDKAKKDFFNTAIETDKDPSYLWKHIKNILPESSHNITPRHFNVNEKWSTEPAGGMIHTLFFNTNH